MFNFAFIGCGLMANWHAQELLRSGHVRAVAAVDPALSNARSFCQKYAPDAPTFGTLEALLADPPADLHGVVIVTPHTLHARLALTALDAGLHVLVEKPMVTSVADAYALWHAVVRSGKLLGITFQAPYTFNFGYLAAARDAGDLGRVQVANGFVSQGWLRLSAHSWRQDPACPAAGSSTTPGPTWPQRPDVADERPRRRRRRRAGRPRVAGRRDRVGHHAVPRRGRRRLAFAGDAEPFDSRLTLFTDRYTIDTNAYGTRLAMTGRDGHPFHPPVPFAEGRGTPHANFVDALLGRQPLAVGVRYGVLLSALMDAVYQSAAAGTAVRVAPVPDAL